MVFKPDYLHGKPTERTGDEAIPLHPLVANEISATMGLGDYDAPHFEFGGGKLPN
jgi:hypothetical protein